LISKRIGQLDKAESSSGVIDECTVNFGFCLTSLLLAPSTNFWNLLKQVC